MEAQPSMTGYVRELVRRDKHERDMHDERLDFAALKASELQAENAKLRELVRISIEYCNSGTCDECPIQDEDGSCPYEELARKLGVEVKQ
jgi:hypothetical protein